METQLSINTHLLKQLHNTILSVMLLGHVVWKCLNNMPQFD